MKRFSLTIIFVLFGLVLASSLVNAQTIDIVAKVVKDTDFSPISGANVTYFIDTVAYSGGTTGSDGYSSHVFVESGKTITITATHQDYFTQTIAYTVSDASPVTITIALQANDSTDGNDPPTISGIPDQFVEENDDEQDNLIDLWDYASDDEDSDSELTFTILSESNTGLINCFIEADRYVSCEEPDEDETGSSTITVTVIDQDNLQDTDTFTIFVEDDFDDDEFICNDIEITTDNLTVSEGKTSTKNVSIFNDNFRSFEVDFVTVTESSSDYTIDIVDDDFTISGNSTKTLQLEFDVDNVSSTKESEITVKLSGEFSNGQDCGTGDIEHEIDVTISNSAFDNQINLTLLPSSIELLAGQSKIVKATFENEFSSTKCFDLEASSNSAFISASVEDDDFCVSPNDDREIDVIITALPNATAQSYTVQLEAEYSNGTKFGFISVKVNAPTPPSYSDPFNVTNFEQTVVLQQTQSKPFSLTITNNTQSTLSNISITMQNLPQGVFFEPRYIPSLARGQTTTITTTMQAISPNAGSFNSTLEVSSDHGNSTKNVTISVPQTEENGNQDSTDGTGFVGLIGTAGTALVLLLVLVVFVVLIVKILTRKN